MNKGDIVVDRYRLEDKLGMGGMGTVWSAEHTQTGRWFALKIMHATVAASDDSRQRFLKEAKASARIDHANVIDVLDVGELPDGGLFMAMELLDGLPLSDALRLEPPLSIHELLVVLRDACSALAAAHAVGIIHRDVKPANIFLHRDKQTGTLRPKLLDFGVSKFSFLEESATHTGSLLGSPRYMSPEQARSATQADQRSDVWSLGVILFEGLIGAYPHEGDSFSNLVVAIATMPPRSAQAAVPSAERMLTSLIDECLRPRDTRVPSCDALGARIDAILAHRDLSNVPCARGKNKKGLDRPGDFAVRTPVANAPPPPRPSFQDLAPVSVEEPSTNPATTMPGAPGRGFDANEATSLYSAATAGAARPRGAQTLLSPSAPAPSPRAQRPPPPSPHAYGQEATLIHTRAPSVGEVDANASSKADFRTTVPMNAGLVAPPLAPPSAPPPAPSVAALPAGAKTQLMPPASPTHAHAGVLVGGGDGRDQLVESISTFNVERYRPGATPFSAPPPNDVETTASRNRNRKASLLIAVGGASVISLAFVVIFLMGRAQSPGPDAPAPIEATPAATAEAPPARPEPRPATSVDEAGDEAAGAEEPATPPSPASAPSASAVPSASSTASGPPAWTPPPGYVPPPNGPPRPKKDCDKDPIGCLDSGLK